METAKTEAAPAANAATVAQTVTKERRISRRFHCDGTVEINRIPSTGKRQGKLKDLSQTGCFVEMEQPFAAPAYVEIVIDTHTMKLRLTGTVKSSRKTGMGIEFAQIGSSAKRLLQDLIVELKESEDTAKPEPPSNQPV